MFRVVIAVLVIILFVTIGQCQFASMFDKAQLAPNCKTWSEWGPCVWVKGHSRNKSSYFDQLSDSCKRNGFFKTTKNFYGQAIDNVYNYLRSIGKDKDACGLCSYRQSCGSVCTARKRSNEYVNQVFVAEERCNEQQLDGNDQLTACYDDYYQVPPENKECQIWPNRRIPLPNVPEMYKTLIYDMPLFNCVKATDDKNQPVCRCCCAPYVPSPKHNYLCIPPKQ